MAIRITHVSGYQRGRASRTKLPVPAADIEHHAEPRNDAAALVAAAAARSAGEADEDEC